jgi:phosphatidylglycerophosphate synthase
MFALVTPLEDRGLILPNLLSLSRIPLAGLLWIMPAEPVWVLSIMAVAGITDVLDGWLARRWRAERWRSRDPGAFAASVARGEVIDGFADKVFVVSAVAALAFVLRPPSWTVVALVSRELLFVPLMLAYRVVPERLRSRVDFTAGVPGKGATIAQFVALVLGFLAHPLYPSAALGAGVLGVIAVAYYLVRVYRRERE